MRTGLHKQQAGRHMSGVTSSPAQAFETVANQTMQQVIPSLQLENLAVK